MPSIVVTGELSEKLAGASELVEIRDADGKLLGVFDPGPSEEEKKLLSQLQNDGFEVTITQLRRSLREVKRAINDPNYARNWKTTDEIMAALKAMP